jgi:UDP-N-acetylmuramoyl-L-alanyl-D-glutamate--2,6-diaminopimelate ligase
MRNLMAMLRRLPGAVATGETDVVCLNVVRDHRLVHPGSLYVAIPGSVVDGHAFIDDAIEFGAVAIVGQQPKPDDCTVAYVQVEHASQAYAKLVHALHDDPQEGMRLYGVTGTNGKTTCTHILQQLLTEAGREAALVGTTGIRFGGHWYPTQHTTPDAAVLVELLAEMRRANVDTVCMEVSSHALDQGRVAGLRWQGAIFTNLSHDHLDYHGSMERYAAAKQTLFESLSADAVAVLNADDEWTPTMRRNCRARRLITVGESDDATVQITDINCTATGSTFSLVLPPEKRGGVPRDVEFSIPLLGRFNVHNAALCAVMAIQENVPIHRIQAAMKVLRSPTGRMERYSVGRGISAVVDYAHTPEALRVALATLRDVLPPRHAITVVFGCGGDRDKAKRAIMGRIAALGANKIVLTSDNPRNEPPHAIIADIAEGIDERYAPRVHVEVDRREAIRYALSNARHGDIVLIAGKGHEAEQIIGDERRPFSDAAEVSAWNRKK